MSYKQITSFAAKAEEGSVRRGLNWGPFEYIILLFHGEAKDEGHFLTWKYSQVLCHENIIYFLQTTLGKVSIKH